MKQFISGTAAIAATLVLAGTALAQSFNSRLVPQITPHPGAWLQLVDASPRHTSATRQSAPQPRGNSLSLYERSVRPRALAKQGCEAAHRGDSGVVVLDFGKPAYAGHGYGTLLFSGRFALNHKITLAMLGWARGYVRCLPAGSTASVSLARGTSNYHPDVPSAYTAGLRWARAVLTLQWKLHRARLDEHVVSAAADDAEPAWDRHFRNTRLFIHGFRSSSHGHMLYDYGSLDGGVGSIWSAHQAFYVAGGIKHTAALPEIYYGAQAREWAELAAIARSRFHTPIHFAGVMTQGSSSCHCGFRPHQAHRALTHAISDYEGAGVGREVVPRGGTNIISG